MIPALFQGKPWGIFRGRRETAASAQISLDSQRKWRYTKENGAGAPGWEERSGRGTAQRAGGDF